MRAIHLIFTTICQNQLKACQSSVHIFYSSFRIIASAFIRIINDDRRCNRAGNICLIQDQIHHCRCILPGLFAKIHCDLSPGHASCDTISSRRRNGNYCIFRSLLFCMTVCFIAFSIQFILPFLIIYDLCSSKHRRGSILRNRFSIHQNHFIGQDDFCLTGILYCIRPAFPESFFCHSHARTGCHPYGHTRRT